MAAEGSKGEGRVSAEGTRWLTNSKSEFLDDRDLVATEAFEEGRVDPYMRGSLLSTEPETLSEVAQGDLNSYTGTKLETQQWRRREDSVRNLNDEFEARNLGKEVEPREFNEVEARYLSGEIEARNPSREVEPRELSEEVGARTLSG